jgi:hypothetical protein
MIKINKMGMTERTTKIKGLIHDKVCMGTVSCMASWGLVELKLLKIEKEMEALRHSIGSFRVAATGSCMASWGLNAP